MHEANHGKPFANITETVVKTISRNGSRCLAMVIFILQWDHLLRLELAYNWKTANLALGGAGSVNISFRAMKSHHVLGDDAFQNESSREFFNAIDELKSCGANRDIDDLPEVHQLLRH